MEFCQFNNRCVIAVEKFKKYYYSSWAYYFANVAYSMSAL